MTNETYYILSSKRGEDGLPESVIKFDDVEYSVLIDDLTGFAGYPVEYDTFQPPGYIGSIINSSVMVPREINLHIMIWGKNRVELEERRAKLIDAVNPVYGEAQLYWIQANGTPYSLYVVPDEGSPEFDTGTSSTATSWECNLTLIAHDPTWHAFDLKTIQFIGERKGLQFPFNVTKDNPSYPSMQGFTLGANNPATRFINVGNINTPCYIVITGAMYKPIVLENQTTNQKITVRKDVAEGEVLIIDTSDENLSVTHIDSSGNRTNALHYCSVGSEFWQLVPGENLIKYECQSLGAQATGTLAYRPRWLCK